LDGSGVLRLVPCCTCRLLDPRRLHPVCRPNRPFWLAGSGPVLSARVRRAPAHHASSRAAGHAACSSARQEHEAVAIDPARMCPKCRARCGERRRRRSQEMADTLGGTVVLARTADHVVSRIVLSRTR
jgi:hypothetical protein